MGYVNGTVPYFLQKSYVKFNDWHQMSSVPDTLGLSLDQFQQEPATLLLDNLPCQTKEGLILPCEE